jgi:hypothetical protein
MPGDELDTTPTFLSTRAVTIAGTPEQIWPWLLQMGYGRAGFSGYDILENLGSPRGLDSADHIVPEFQHFKVGDAVPISGAASAVFYAVEPNQYLVWAGLASQKPGGFTWALYPAEARFEEAQAAAQEKTELLNRLEARKAVERAKGILMQTGMTEEDSYRTLQQRARAARQTMQQAAEELLAEKDNPAKE